MKIDPNDTLRSLLTMLDEQQTDRPDLHRQAIIDALDALTIHIESGGELPQVNIVHRPFVTVGEM